MSGSPSSRRWCARPPSRRPSGRLIAGHQAAGVAGDSPRDLLDTLLEACDPAGFPLTAAEIHDEVTGFLLTGSETSATTLTWALALLSAYPAARERLEAELGSVLGGRSPQAGDVDRLPYANAVICEAMRLFPPAWSMERDALDSDVIDGVAVPAHSMVVMAPYLAHRHPEFWPDPAGLEQSLNRRFQHTGTWANGCHSPADVMERRRRAGCPSRRAG